MLLIFINGLFQEFSLELWFHEHLITHPKLTHEIEYNFRLFFLSILTTSLYHTLFQLCGPFFVVIIKFWKNFTLKKQSVFPSQNQRFWQNYDYSHSLYFPQSHWLDVFIY